MSPTLSSDSSDALPLSSVAQSPADPSHPNHLLPIPTPSANRSQSSFTFTDVDSADAEELPPEIASADISLAPDGSYVETSSGAAARELKRRYDQHWRVNNKDVRSPYATTAYVNQHGKQMFRVGLRDASAPAASAAEAEQRASQSKSPTDPPTDSRRDHSKHQSRLSMHAFLNPTSKSAAPPVKPDHGPRKLRKTRSIPDMFGFAASGASAGASSSSATRSQQKQPTATGRVHSHSVTGADMPRLPTPMVDVAPAPRGDLFGDVMHWTSTPTAPSSAASSSMSPSARILAIPGEGGSTNPYEHGQPPPAIILQPFGPGVAFDSPSRRPTSTYLPAPHPHMLREMQSFESGLTARAADPDTRVLGKGKAPALIMPEIDTSDFLRTQSPSPSIRTPVPTSSHKEFEPPDTGLAPLPGTSMHSRYSTDVFDVLQTYRGLPLLDRISPDSGETTVIKMSLRSDDTAAPRDDPRFVIWGEMQVERDDDVSVSQGSRTDMSSSAPSSHLSRRKSGKAAKAGSLSMTMAVAPVMQPPSEDGDQPKILVAATIERWIAQLTSDLDYDELLVFLLTYRTYITAVDLLHLLICRFHWALGQPASAQDERVRRIVRVRTFVAIRYWLLTFFAEDFLPNRELRLLLADWLNALIRDPILEKHNDGLSIVRKLKKIVKECKEAHTRKGKHSSSARLSTSGKAPRPSVGTTQSRSRSTVSHLLGDKFAEAVGLSQEDDSDLDLDFVADEAPSSTAPGFQNDVVANAHLTSAHVGSGMSSPPRSTAAVSSPALALLQQPLQQTILQQAHRSLAPGPSVTTTFAPSPDALPIHHSTFSRVFVKTLGRLGRWKRVLNSGSVVHAPLGACADVSAFDLELNESGDLLTVRGGVESYLKILEQQPVSPSPLQDSTPKASMNTSRSTNRATLVNDDPPEYDETVETKSDAVASDSSQTVGETSDAVDTSDRKAPEPTLRHPALRRVRSRDSLSSSNSGYGNTIPQSEREPWRFDVVSIDDLDFSDTSSDYHAAGPPLPPGLRRPPRRLPLRRDFEFVRRSGESVSSMGISRESYASGVSTNSAMSSSSAGPGLGGNIQQWQMNALVDSLSDDEETGDVENALRRLEGQINPTKKQEKASKVDGWVRAIQARQAAGDYGDEYPRFLSDEEDAGADEESNVETGSAHWSGHDEDVTFSATSHSEPASPNDLNDSSDQADPGSTPIAPQLPLNISGAPGPGSPLRDAKPAPEDAVPIEILQSRVSSRPSTSHGSPEEKAIPNLTSPPSKFVLPSGPRVHRSFILGYRAETLVHHFSMIDRELFMGVRSEELILDDWMSCDEVNVLDWAQYLKDRARWKAESRLAHKTSTLAAVRARFNLIANFVLSEVVLTHPSERALVVGKFIRMAWKAYCLSNFNTLVAIIAGLRSEWVTKAMRRWWHRVGMWETRMFNDFKEWTSSADDFKYIRQAVASIADAKPINVSSHTPSIISTGGTDGQSLKSKAPSESKPPLPSACVPFIGVYLSQLHRHSKLPDLIDPTAPNEAVNVDPFTGNFDTPAHPEVFSSLAPLPPSMQLEPLINVHKQRLIAGVIKSLVAGQHLASRIQYPVDKKLFQRCLKLRGLDSDTLQRVYASVP